MNPMHLLRRRKGRLLMVEQRQEVPQHKHQQIENHKNQMIIETNAQCNPQEMPQMPSLQIETSQK